MIVLADPDRGGQDADRDTLFAFDRLRDLAPRARGTVVAFGNDRMFATLGGGGTLGTLAVIALRALGTVLALGPVVALGAILALGTIAALRAFASRFAVLTIAVAARRGTLVLAIVIVVRLMVGAGHLFVAIAIFFITRATLILFLETRAAILEDAEIMIGELEIIFGLNTIPGELHVARQCLVFLKQLGGIAALAIVLTVAVRTI